jgi:hypothetical protein
MVELRTCWTQFGVPNRATSLSGAFTSAGKFLVILTCYFGKTRGLPKARDQVIDFRFAKLKNSLHDLEVDRRRKEGGISSTIMPSSSVVEKS